jgi:hypothetical protein
MIVLLASLRPGARLVAEPGNEKAVGRRLDHAHGLAGESPDMKTAMGSEVSPMAVSLR